VLVIVDPDRRSNYGSRSNKDRDPLFFGSRSWGRIAILGSDRDLGVGSRSWGRIAILGSDRDLFFNGSRSDPKIAIREKTDRDPEGKIAIGSTFFSKK
jgi:hypothetical protein